MKLGKEFKVISDRTVDHLPKTLEEHSSDGWEIEAYFQEYGVTKILISRNKETTS